MNRLTSTCSCLVLLGAVACAKKEPKPLRTEPWLAHPPASARESASGDAALPSTRYRLDERSSIHFEIPSKRGALSGAVTRVTGELNVDFSDLTHSRGLVRADLSSLTIRAGTGAEGSEAALVERARTALELSSDAPASSAFASFDLTSIEDASPTQLEPAHAREADAPYSRKARLVAVGNLLLHGFRVTRRAPLEVEFSFDGDRPVPQRVAIRSRTPFVISLETHAIVALGNENVAKGTSKGAATAPAQAREVRVSVELYGTKVD